MFQFEKQNIIISDDIDLKEHIPKTSQTFQTDIVQFNN